MNLRDAVIGGVVTLLISIAAGLAVWYLTKEPSIALEKLYFSTSVISGPKEDQKNISFANINLANVGGKTAKNFQMIITFDKDFKITEKQVSSSIGSVASAHIIEIESNRITVAGETLSPEETVAVALVVSGPDTPVVHVSARSDESVASVGATSKSDPSETSLLRTKFFAPGLVILGTLVGVIATNLILRYARRKFSTVIRFANDTAFMLMHKKLIDEADMILSGAIKRSGADAIELCNMAFIAGIKGDSEKSEAYFSASDWLSSQYIKNDETQSTRQQVVSKFNRAILFIVAGDFVKGKKIIQEAAVLDRAEIVKYCALSDYFRDASKASDLMLDLQREMTPTL